MPSRGACMRHALVPVFLPSRRTSRMELQAKKKVRDYTIMQAFCDRSMADWFFLFGSCFHGAAISAKPCELNTIKITHISAADSTIPVARCSLQSA